MIERLIFQDRLWFNECTTNSECTGAFRAALIVYGRRIPLFCAGQDEHVVASGASGYLRRESLLQSRYHEHMQQFQRITIDPEIMSGKPCIRGMRVTVGMIVEALSAGRTIDQLLADFPYLEDQDIREALAFAASLAQGYDVRIAS